MTAKPSSKLLVLTAFAAVLLVVPAALGARTDVSWTQPTPADKARFDVEAGSKLSLKLIAATTTPRGIVHIAPAGALPRGAVFTASDGPVASASFQWVTSARGDFRVAFAATGTGADLAAPTLTYTIHVRAKPAAPAQVKFPRSVKVTDEKVAYWTPVLRRAVVRTKPRKSARAVTVLDTWTTDDTQNIVLVLEQRDVKRNQTWYRVRLPILPNNSTGWVEARFLGDLYKVHTHLYVDRAKLRATLKKDGRVVFTTIVGVGKSFWPTPRGEFYVRDKLTGFGNPVYGPIAFGTSARSPTLTDWPGGGFVGVHGTNEPSILPGRVSHGCVRMPNSSILELARLMPVGTPLTIR